MTEKDDHATYSGQGRGQGSRDENKIAVAIQSIKGSIEAAHNDTKQQTQNNLRWIKITGGAAILYTVVTCAVFGVSLYTAHVASEASNAATQQATTASDTEKRQLRAYVGLIPGDLENFGDKDAQVFTLKRKNFGATPAYDLFWATQGQAVIQLGAPLPEAGTTPTTMQRLMTLFPTMESNYKFTGIAVAPEQITAFRQIANMRYVYFGSFTYKDAFGVGRYTRYCWMFKNDRFTAADAEGCLGNNDSD